MISELICYMFKIRKAWQMWLIGCLLISTPSIATMLVYQALDYFGIAALLAVLAAVLLSRNTYFHRFLGVLCLTFSVGAYQPFLGFTLTLLVLDCIVKLIKNTRIKDVLFDGMRYVLGSGIALGLYYIILNIILRVKNIELSSYKGMDSVMTKINPLNLINSIYKAYCDVLDFFVFDILGIQGGECTSDGLYSLEDCRCIGACGLAPVMTVNDEVYGRLTVDEVSSILAKYK